MKQIRTAVTPFAVTPGVWWALVCLLVWGQVWAASPTPGIYTCVDANGRKLTSDRWIADCADREQKILNPSGSVNTVLVPALTPLEQQQLEAKKKADQAELARQQEVKKRDRALLARYPNQAAHQKERVTALAQVAGARQAIAGSVQALQAERLKLTQEMDFYAKDPGKAPPRLRARLAAVDDNLAAQARADMEQVAEIARIHARFDAEALRLKPGW